MLESYARLLCQTGLGSLPALYLLLICAIKVSISAIVLFYVTKTINKPSFYTFSDTKEYKS
jgi:hypothetical protein